jgi:hypothetical protein
MSWLTLAPVVAHIDEEAELGADVLVGRGGDGADRRLVEDTCKAITTDRGGKTGLARPLVRG